jgi:hypothetical protein
MALTTPTGQPSDNQSTDFAGASVPSLIGYKFKELDPGANIYIQRDDKLVIQHMSFVAGEVFNINVRLLQPGHPAGRTQPGTDTIDNPLGDSPYGVIVPINRMVPVTIADTVQTITLDLAEGYLMSVGVSATTATMRGQSFIRIFLIRGSSSVSNFSYVLCSDYVTNATPTGWPFGNVTSPLDGAGLFMEFAPANPGAGLDFGFVLTPLRRAELRSCSATLTTSAAVANRIVSGILFDVGVGRTLGAFPANIAIPATTVARVTFAPCSIGAALGATIVNVNMPTPTKITQANAGPVQFSVQTTNLQAGDQWSNIAASFEVWYDF